MMDSFSILFVRSLMFYKFDLPIINQGINELDTMVTENMIPICMGYGLLIPMMYMVMNMMSSYVKTFDNHDLADHYMLCERVGDLEQELKSLKENIISTKSMKHESSYTKLVKGLETKSE